MLLLKQKHDKNFESWSTTSAFKDTAHDTESSHSECASCKLSTSPPATLVNWPDTSINSQAYQLSPSSRSLSSPKKRHFTLILYNIITPYKVEQHFNRCSTAIITHFHELSKVSTFGIWVSHEVAKSKLNHNVILCLSLRTKHAMKKFLERIVTIWWILCPL